MGDRRATVLHFPEDGYSADIGVYSHWDGYRLEEMVRGVAGSKAFQNRLGDEAYAARIAIDQLTKDARDEETGYGVFPLVRGGPPLSQFADASVETAVHLDLVTGDVWVGERV